MPLSELAVPNRVVGVRSVRKKLDAGKLTRLFLARDAHHSLVSDLASDAQKAGISVEWIESMAVLGRACAISRGAAAAGILVLQERESPEVRRYL
ncbi:MAG TPA: 50S ribosomal protein L7ae [Synergistetes bacterium]|nr:50S ribosomal protein L7ae [Synergistota bacterium]